DRPDRLAGGAPDLASGENPANLGLAVRDCLGLAEQFLKAKGGYRDDKATPADGPPAEKKEEPARAVAARAPVGNDRSTLYRQIEQTAAALRRLEPHSPIPFLIERCVALGRLEFPELMKRIVRTQGALTEIDLLLGREDVAAATAAGAMGGAS